MGVVYNFDSLARVLESAEPTVYNGSWKVIKGGLIESGEIAESAGVVQKVVTINEAASATETAGETLSALCAMDVSESTVAGATVTTLTPKAAITFTPKTVALCGVAGALGLDFGFRLGQNLVNLYYGDDWDWHAPGIFDKAKDAIRTYVKADGTTYYDEETVNAFANRLNEIGAFSDSEIVRDTVELNNFKVYNNLGNNSINAIRFPGMRETLAYAISKGAVLGDYSVFRFIPYSGYNGKWYNLSIDTYYSNDINFNIYTGAVNCNVPGTSGIKISGSFRNQVKSKRYDVTLVNPTGIDKDLSMGVSYELQAEDGENMFMENSETYTKSFTSSSNGNTFTYDSIGVEGSSLTGVSKQDGATIPTTFPLEIPEIYPTWQPSPINKPDGEIKTYPVEMPDTDPLAEKATKPQNEAQKGKNKDPKNNPVIGIAIGIVPEIVPNIPTPQEPTIDDGDTPTPIIPAIGVQGTGFVALYNPTQSQLSAFSQYLWSKDFIDNFKKLFSNPMEAIIGLHLIYATPSRGDVAEIVCGYSHSGVMSNTVNNQYIEIDCGSIKVNRYFGNVLDYAPYTKLQVYLPFVGIVDLDTNEIMDGTLNIKYRIDVLTGSCLARLKITRGDYNAELYNFAGNCAVQLPISGGSYSGIIANAIGVAGSLGATIATGGAMAPVLVGSVVSSAVNSRTNVSHSGSLGSNAGALGIMKPYLIITRPKPAEANHFNEFYGKPSNKTVRLSSCSGYTRVKDVHVDNIVATNNELSEIEQLLKQGVIL